jgi:hypothetical protein
VNPGFTLTGIAFPVQPVTLTGFTLTGFAFPIPVPVRKVFVVPNPTRTFVVPALRGNAQ